MAVADLILMSLQPCRILYSPLLFIFSPNDSPLTKKIFHLKIYSISFKNLFHSGNIQIFVIFCLFYPHFSELKEKMKVE